MINYFSNDSWLEDGTIKKYETSVEKLTKKTFFF